ncbi:CAMK family protein kinase [Tritrichomonas foetus]|uniref:CAMK family protein kinase n=1 Tax=Tritrichomonas foetus TaxID=1144522 RepID=A0A1J4KB64_9EUKA|nr:CAMK family protein kinase [Tritrichomonas foetus]|eukprot:OHT08194.1 CAMK family protein kinase [Tritrichomonas foetus]
MFLQRKNDTRDNSSDDSATLNKICDTLKKHSFTYLRPVGEGGFGSVYLVLSERYNQEFVAKVSKCPENTAEVTNLFNLDHPNIIKMFEYFTDANYLYVILEYCTGGSLKDVIRSTGPIKPPLLYNYCAQLLEALKYVHSRKMSHRDIKPSNILIDRNGRPKLADFDMGDNREIVNDIRGTKPYMAPELFQKNSYDPSIADIWSLGVTFYEMASGRLPWDSSKENQMVMDICNGFVQIYIHEFSREMTRLLRRMCEPDISKRATLDELLEMDFIQKNKKSLRQLTKASSYQLKRNKSLISFTTQCCPNSNSQSNLVFQRPNLNNRKKVNLTSKHAHQKSHSNFQNEQPSSLTKEQCNSHIHNPDQTPKMTSNISSRQINVSKTSINLKSLERNNSLPRIVEKDGKAILSMNTYGSVASLQKYKMKDRMIPKIPSTRLLPPSESLHD